MKLSLALLVLLLTLAGAVGQTLTYTLLPDSTLTPASSGAPTGPAQPLTGNFTITQQIPGGAVASDSFVVSNLYLLSGSLVNSTNYYSMNQTNGNASLTTKTGTQGFTGLGVSVTLITNDGPQRLGEGDEPNPCLVATFANGTFYGPTATPARLIFSNVGLYQPVAPGSTQSVNNAILYLDAMLTYDSANTNVLTNTITINATAQMQSPPTVNSNTLVQTMAPPKHFAVNTAQVLAWLAQDEFAAGDYPSTNFPAGAQLVTTGYGTYGNGNDALVLDQNGNLLVDVSNILHLKAPTGLPSYTVLSGKVTPEETFPSPESTQAILELTYDDSAIDGGLHLTFFLQGLANGTVTDTTPDGNGYFTQTMVNTMNNGAGSGAFTTTLGSLPGEGPRITFTPFIITGGISTKGKIVRQE